MMRRFCFLLATLCCVTWATAAINVQFQPRDVWNRYANVLVGEVAAMDGKTLSIELSVKSVVKGKFEPTKVALKAIDRGLLEAVLSVEKGQTVVAFVNQLDRRSPGGLGRDVLYYVGGGKWYKAQVSADDAGAWTITADADAQAQAGSLDIMFAVFNGTAPQLARMADDMANNRDYYPARPFTRFSEVRIDKLPNAVEGVGIHDLNGDGKLDLIATGGVGVRVYLQDAQSKFNDATQQIGLLGVTAHSVAAADVDGDGDADLLLDATLYRQDAGKFTTTELIATKVDAMSAAFAELNGDGLPDVLISKRGGGLVALVNDQGKAMMDRTAELGLHTEALTQGEGYFELGDWNRDGRIDVLYLAGPGWLLLRREEGFEAVALADENDPPEYRTAALAPIAGPDQSGALIVTAEAKMLLINNAGIMVDVTRAGNEIQDDIVGGLMTVAEDFNADGTLDFYIASQQDGAAGFFCTNRGYGSFMLEEKYAPGKVIPAEIYNAPARGLAVGDVNDDGASDLLIGGGDGTLRLLMNQTLTDRPAEAQPQTRLDERKQIQARILTVELKAPRGVIGATVELHDGKGRLIAHRWIGGNVGIGCAAPGRVILTAREPGQHKLTVRFGDGRVVTRAVDLSLNQPRHQRVVIQPPAQ